MTRQNWLTWQRQLAKTAILCTAVVFLLTVGSPRAWPQSDAPDPAVERGRRSFLQSWGFCHGPDATGARGPDLVRSPLLAHDV